MDTRNLKSQNKARITNLEKIDQVTSLSNKQHKPPNNENSAKKLLEQSNSLIDVKSQ